jgi:hypothetical protein
MVGCDTVDRTVKQTFDQGFAVFHHFVETGRFTLEQVIDWMAVKPAEIFGLTVGTLNIVSLPTIPNGDFKKL